MQENFNPIPAMISLTSILGIEIMKSLDSVLTSGIQYAIGILTIIYLLKQIKKKEK